MRRWLVIFVLALAPVVHAQKTYVPPAGKWESKAWSYGVKEGSIKLADFHGLDANVKPDVLKAVTAKFDAIKGGAFVVPHDTSMVQ